MSAAAIHGFEAGIAAGNLAPTPWLSGTPSAAAGDSVYTKLWYVGYTALVAGAAALAFSFSRRPRQQVRWALGLTPLTVGVPWVLLAGPYL
ncbi:hypothetical protein [Streptomyces chartreusis]